MVVVGADVHKRTHTFVAVDEVGRKLAEISDKLRTSLRSYVAHSLGDMLSFNESLMRAANDDACTAPKGKGLSALGVQATPLDAVAPGWLLIYRRHGRFGATA